MDLSLKMEHTLHPAREVSNLDNHTPRPAGEVSNLDNHTPRPAGEVSNLASYMLIFCCSLLFSLNTVAQPLPQFTDITHEAGIDFVHNTGAFGQEIPA